MARCGCSGATCSCIVVGGDNVTVTGVGSPTSPYIVNSSGMSIAVQDTPTLDLGLGGDGSPSNPYTIFGTVTARLDDLTDVTATGGTTGWVLAQQAGGGFALQAPTTAPVGAINVGCGLSGDGSAGLPLTVMAKSQSQWNTDTGSLPDTSGRSVYCLSTGLYTKPPQTYLDLRLNVASTGPSGQTATLHLPYPLDTDGPNVPRDFSALAAALDKGTVFAGAAAPVTPKPGQLWYNTTSKAAYQWDGSTWCQAYGRATPFATACGVAAVSTGGAVSGSAAVTFPAGRFAVAPNVVATAAGTLSYCAMVSSVSATGFSALIAREAPCAR